MKIKFLPIIMAVILLAVSVNIQADNTFELFIDNEKQEYDIEPMIINGTAMAPMRYVFEKLGAEVKWWSETNTATAYKDGEYVSVSIGSPYIDTFFGAIEMETPAILVEGRTFIPLKAISEVFGCTVNFDDKTNTANIFSKNYIDYSKADGEQITVNVSNAEELAEAIGSNRRIVLTSDYYNLSDIEGLNGLVIENVVNMTIEGNSEIAIDNIMADVLAFKKCGNITLSGLTIGHTNGNDFYQCEGAVTRFEICDNIKINNCNLYGCGAFGISAINVSNLKVNNSKIYDCTYTGIWLENNSDAEVINTEFFDSIHESGFIRIDNSKISLIDCNIHDITCGDYSAFIDTFDHGGEPSVISFENCKFTDNVYNKFAAVEIKSLTFTKCIFKNNSGKVEHPAAVYNDCSF